jgi:uncharacterized protein (TIGR02246 family)
MPNTTPVTGDDAEVRECIEAVAAALRAKDIDALMAHYASDVVVFDLMPLQLTGAAAYRKNFEAWFGAVRGPLGFEIHDLRITRTGGVAFCHYLAHVRSTRTTGAHADYRVRVTAGLRELNGRWMLTHEHVSVPFANVESMQAALASGTESP